MKLTEKHQKMLDYLYNEMNSEERVEFEKMLSDSEELRMEFEELKTGSKAMHAWDVPEHKTNLMFVKETFSLRDKLKEFMPGNSIASGSIKSFAYGLAAVFLLFSFTNFNVQYDGETGSFTVGASIFGTNAKQQADEDNYELMTQQLIQQQQTILEMVDQVLADRDQMQKEQFTNTLTSLSRELDRRREKDMQEVGSYIFQIQDRNDKNILDTRESLISMLSTAGIEIKK